jgi:thiamine-phosphate pyrophosphorylase
MDILKLCLVTNYWQQKLSFEGYTQIILKAVHGGVTSVQLREKTKNLAEYTQLALKFKAILQPFNVPLILNDHVDIAKEIDADGVHIGQDDMSPLEARKILGSSKIIGLSVYTQQQLYIANRLENIIDYIGVGAISSSKTKPDCIPIGLAGLKNITDLSRYPVIAIGGITSKNVGAVIKNGACGIAVVDAIHNAVDAEKSAEKLITEINYSLKQHQEKLCLKK